MMTVQSDDVESAQLNEEPASNNIDKSHLTSFVKTGLGVLVGLGIALYINFSFSPLFFSFAIVGGTLGHFISLKGKKDNLKKLYKTIGVYPFLGIILYAFWLSFWMINANLWLVDYEILNILFSNRADPTDFSISYAASSLDSFVFFVLIGLVLAIISFKKPQEENLGTKIEYIFPDVKGTPLTEYLKDGVTKLACISPITERTITLQEISKCGKFIKVLIKSHAVIKNLHNNHEYSQKSAKFKLFASEPHPADEVILGEAHDASVIYTLNGTKHTKHVINNVVQLTKESPEYSKKFPIRLDSEQSAIYQTSGWLWQPISTETFSTEAEKNEQTLSFSVFRYTEQQTFKVINYTNRHIEVFFEAPNVPDKHTEIPPSKNENEEHSDFFDAGWVKPTDKVALFLRFPVAGPLPQKDKVEPQKDKVEPQKDKVK